MPTRDTPKSQSQKFIDKAKELEVDEDESAFEERLRKVAKPENPRRGKDKS